MAEFCHECYRKILKEEIEESRLILSKDLDICEGCREFKHVVVDIIEPSFFHFWRIFLSKKDTHS